MSSENPGMARRRHQKPARVYHKCVGVGRQAQLPRDGRFHRSGSAIFIRCCRRKIPIGLKITDIEEKEGQAGGWLATSGARDAVIEPAFLALPSNRPPARERTRARDARKHTSGQKKGGLQRAGAPKGPRRSRHAKGAPPAKTRAAPQGSVRRTGACPPPRGWTPPLRRRRGAPTGLPPACGGGAPHRPWSSFHGVLRPAGASFRPGAGQKQICVSTARIPARRPTAPRPKSPGCRVSPGDPPRRPGGAPALLGCSQTAEWGRIVRFEIHAPPTKGVFIPAPSCKRGVRG